MVFLSNNYKGRYSKEEMNVFLKNIIAMTMFVVALFNAVSMDTSLMFDRPNGGIRQGLYMYCQPENTIDVVMLGSSHVNYGINTAKLWSDYGIAAYDYSTAEQAIWTSYYYLREICKYQNPKVVVLDFFAPAAYGDDYNDKYYFAEDALSGLKFSLNKRELVNVIFDGNADLINKYAPSYATGSNDDLNTKLKESWKKDYSAYKGYTPSFKAAALETPVISSTEAVPPSDKSVEYLNKIIDYTGEHGIKLYLTVIPYKVNTVREPGVTQEEDVRYNWLEQYIAQINANGNNNVFFDYTFRHLADTGIDFEGGTHFADGSAHLNYYGSTQFASYLGQDLKNRYGDELIPDRRGQAGYESWNAHVEEIRAMVEQEGWEYR